MSQAAQPRYAVIIPTRNRPDTCIHAIGTVIACRRSDVEIIVPDASDDCAALPAMLRRAGLDGNVRLLPAPAERRLSMRENWERAIDETTAPWLIYIGDDDGVLPSGFEMLDALTEAPIAPVIAWEPVDYRWPCYPGGSAGQMTIPLQSPGLQLVDAEQALTRHFAWGTRLKWPAIGPSIYHGAVHRDLIDRVRARHGAYFLSFIVDYASAIGNAAEICSYLRYAAPISILGASGKSNSAGLTASGEGKKRYADVMAENPGLTPLHPRLSQSRLHAPLVAEGYRQTFAALDAAFSLAPERMLESCVDELSMIADPQAFAQEREILLDFAHAAGVSAAPVQTAEFAPHRCGVGLDAARKSYFVDTTPLGWRTVMDAAQGVGAFLQSAAIPPEQARRALAQAVDQLRSRQIAAA